MADVLKIEGDKELVRALQSLKKRMGGRVSVLVGYSASYALFVHENTEMKLRGKPRPKGRGRYWDPQGRAQPKFLESVIRQKPRQIQLQIQKHAANEKSKNPVLAGLLAGAAYIQRESQMRVPVDTGNLKASAFIEVEEG